MNNGDEGGGDERGAARIRELDRSRLEAAVRHDPDGAAAVFAEDGELVLPGLPPILGRDAIRDFYRQRPEGLQLDSQEPEAREVHVAESGGAAVVRGFAGKSDARIGGYVAVWVRRGVDWRLRTLISSAETPEPVPAGSVPAEARPFWKRVPRWALLGCGTAAAAGIALGVGITWWLVSSPESGVRVGSQVEPYALRYLADHGLVEKGERVLAYYDATITMDGSEAAILTEERVMYHESGYTFEIPLSSVVDVRHTYESWVGDIIEVEDAEGQVLTIEIAPMNQGRRFFNALLSAWRRGKVTPRSIGPPRNARNEHEAWSPPGREAPNARG